MIQSFRALLNRIYIIPVLAAALFHAGLSLTFDFFDNKWLRPTDYALGLAAIILVPLFLLVLRPSVHLRAGHFLTAFIMIAYLISCAVMTQIKQKPVFTFNRVFLYDTFVSLIFFYPLGHYFGRKKKVPLLKFFAHLFLAVWTVFILLVLILMLFRHPVGLPSGNMILISEDGLSLGGNPNTTGLIQMLVIFLSFLLFSADHSVRMKKLCLLAALIHTAALILSKSDTTFYTAAACVSVFGFLFYYKRNNNLSLDLRITSAVVAMAGILLIFLLEGFIVTAIWSGTETDNTTPENTVGAADIQTTVHLTGSGGSSFWTEAPASLTRFQTGTAVHSSGFRNTVSDRIPAVLAAAESDKDTAGKSPRYGKGFHILNSILSGRMFLWVYAIWAITANPLRFLTGVTPVYVVETISELSKGKYVFNTHNQFLEIALAIGVPAMLAFLILILYTVRNSYKLYRNPDSSLTAMMIPLILTAILIANFTEATLLFYRFISSYVFFFLCGWVNERRFAVRTASLSRKSPASSMQQIIKQKS